MWANPNFEGQTNGAASSHPICKRGFKGEPHRYFSKKNIHTKTFQQYILNNRKTFNKQNEQLIFVNFNECHTTCTFET